MRIGNLLSIVAMMSSTAMLALPAQADEAGDALLNKCIQATRQIKTLQGEFTLRIAGESDRAILGTLALKRPNLGKLVISGAESFTIISDGKQFVRYEREAKEYSIQTADPKGADISHVGCVEAMVFFQPETLKRFKAMGKGVSVVGNRKIGETLCKVLRVMGAPEGLTFEIYIGPDYLLRGTSSVQLTKDGKSTLDSRLTISKTDGLIPATAFAWKAPKDAKLAPITEQAAHEGEETTEKK